MKLGMIVLGSMAERLRRHGHAGREAGEGRRGDRRGRDPELDGLLGLRPGPPGRLLRKQFRGHETRP